MTNEDDFKTSKKSLKTYACLFHKTDESHVPAPFKVDILKSRPLHVDDSVGPLGIFQDHLHAAVQFLGTKQYHHMLLKNLGPKIISLNQKYDIYS